ncbi:hypothetical protein EV356DRAFT_497267 [Viridothelium virens]|uniref:Glycine zipper 2TM domain-containing protein n=1 Tax=Viridothelium virens TaxID=1048519 RepID=A0A6A6HGQ5_VIRVR|nr:hypothetical protein EV356DRAFT_497267 [Viridothelium virens]
MSHILLERNEGQPARYEQQPSQSSNYPTPQYSSYPTPSAPPYGENQSYYQQGPIGMSGPLPNNGTSAYEHMSKEQQGQRPYETYPPQQQPFGLGPNEVYPAGYGQPSRQPAFAPTPGYDGQPPAVEGERGLMGALAGGAAGAYGGHQLGHGVIGGTLGSLLVAVAAAAVAAPPPLHRMTTKRKRKRKRSITVIDGIQECRNEGSVERSKKQWLSPLRTQRQSASCE